MPKGISQKTKQKRTSARDAEKGPKRTPDRVLRDRVEIARLRLEGLTQVQIAEEIARLRDYVLSRQTIAADLKAVRDKWLNQSIDNYEQTRLIELSRLDEEELIAKNQSVNDDAPFLGSMPSKDRRTSTLRSRFCWPLDISSGCRRMAMLRTKPIH